MLASDGYLRSNWGVLKLYYVVGDFGLLALAGSLRSNWGVLMLWYVVGDFRLLAIGTKTNRCDIIVHLTKKPILDIV